MRTTSKTIEVIVLPDGQCRVQTKGFAGPSCLAASRFLERVLGKCSDRQRTGEFYRTDVQQETRTQQRG